MIRRWLQRLFCAQFGHDFVIPVGAKAWDPIVCRHCGLEVKP